MSTTKSAFYVKELNDIAREIDNDMPMSAYVLREAAAYIDELTDVPAQLRAAGFTRRVQ